MLEYVINFFGFIKVDFLSLFLTYVILWVFVIYIVIKAKKVRKNNRPIETSYESPKGVSSILARYIMVSGRLGGVAGEISESGLQTITMIDLYENGGLKDISFIDDYTIEYEIDDDYLNKNLLEEQIKFIELLKENVGDNSRITILDRENISRGFSGVDKFWFKYWNTYLYELCINRGYFSKSKGRWDNALNFLGVSMIFGVFLSFFAVMIPFLGPFIAILFLFPIIIILIVAVALSSLIHLVVSVDFNNIYNLLPEPFNFITFIFLPFMTWFLWIILIGQNIKVALTPITKKGNDIIWEIKGYKEFLSKVDKDRLSFTLDRDLDYQRNNTTFSWLAIFKIAKDRHWDDFFVAHSQTGSNIRLNI